MRILFDQGTPVPPKQHFIRLGMELLQMIVAHLEHHDLSHAELGEQLDISRARAADRREGHAELFSLDALVERADWAALNVRISATWPYRKRSL